MHAPKAALAQTDSDELEEILLYILNMHVLFPKELHTTWLLGDRRYIRPPVFGLCVRLGE